MSHGGGGGDNASGVLVIALGVILILFAVGFFRTSRTFWDTFNLKALMRLPCGVTVEHPSYGAKAQFPLRVDGYANKCGWTHTNGDAGMAQVFDSNGMPVTAPFRLRVPASSADTAPYYFRADLKLLVPPATESGQVVLTSAEGLVHAVPIAF